MRFRRLAGTAAVVAVCATAGAVLPTAADATAAPARIAKSVKFGTMRTDIVVASPTMGKRVSVSVLTPRVDRGPRPTVYLLDGNDAAGGVSDWMSKGGIRSFFADKNVNVVVPRDAAGTFYTNWRKHDPKIGKPQWETFLTSELPAFLASQRQVRPTGSAAVGLSMAGSAALTLAIYHPDDAAAALARIDALEQGEETHWSGDERLVRKDGEVIWANTSVVAVQGPDGGVKHRIIHLQDITEIKLARLRHAETLRTFTSAVENSPIGIGQIDRSGHWVRGNRALCELLGVDEQELAGRSAVAGFTAEDTAALRTARRSILAGTWPVGAKLPTEQQMVADSGLSLTTVRRAYDELVREELVVRRRGAGTFVAPRQQRRSARGSGPLRQRL